MKIQIITDSASDILQDDADRLDVVVMPIKINFNKEEFLDGIDINNDEFYKKLIESDEFPKTSQITPYEYEKEFEKHLDKDILVITLSSKLSGGYQSAIIAAEKYPNVRVVDSENATIGQQILVKYAINMRGEGKDISEIVENLEKEKKNIRLVALLDTLEYLKKGGRISTATALVGTILSIKPVVSVVNGKVEMIGKARGSKNGHNMLRKLVRKNGGINENMPFQVAYAGLSDCLLLKYLEDSKDLYSIESENIERGVIGATIGSHVGPGAIAVAFFKNKC